jgi:hypothetical protein
VRGVRSKDNAAHFEGKSKVITGHANVLTLRRYLNSKYRTELKRKSVARDTWNVLLVSVNIL